MGCTADTKRRARVAVAKPGMLQHLADAVTRLATNPALRRQLATSAAQEIRRNWLWPSAARKMQDIYTHATTTSCEVAA